MQGSPKAELQTSETSDFRDQTSDLERLNICPLFCSCRARS